MSNKKYTATGTKKTSTPGIHEVGSKKWIGQHRKLEAKEAKQPVRWMYLSFADDTEFLGAVVIEAHGPLTACTTSHELKINPGGEILMMDLLKSNFPPVESWNRLLNAAEVKQYFPDSSSQREKYARKTQATATDPNGETPDAPETESLVAAQGPEMNINTHHQARKHVAKDRSNKPLFIFGAVQIWYVEPFKSIDQPVTFCSFPGIPEVMMLKGSHAKSKKTIHDSLAEQAAEQNAEFDVKVIETNGVEGLATTDPHWDGEPNFKCGHCDIEHDVHEAVAENLYRRGRA